MARAALIGLLALCLLASAASAQYVSAAQFKCMFPQVSSSKINSYIAPLNAALSTCGATTLARVRMFMAQTGAETDHYNTFTEYTNADGTNAWCGNYQGGCTYRGRGAMQLTHLSNYQKCGAALGQDFVNNPNLVAQLPWAFSSAAWFWQTHSALNTQSDSGDVTGATRTINGGLNGLSTRQDLYNKAKSCITALGGGAPPVPRPTPHAGGSRGSGGSSGSSGSQSGQPTDPSTQDPSTQDPGSDGCDGGDGGLSADGAGDGGDGGCNGDPSLGDLDPSYSDPSYDDPSYDDPSYYDPDNSGDMPFGDDGGSPDGGDVPIGGDDAPVDDTPPPVDDTPPPVDDTPPPVDDTPPPPPPVDDEPPPVDYDPPPPPPPPPVEEDCCSDWGGGDGDGGDWGR